MREPYPYFCHVIALALLAPGTKQAAALPCRTAAGTHQLS